MNPQLVAILAMTLTDKLIDVMCPPEEQPEEWKVKVRAEMQSYADKEETWLEQEIARLKGGQ